MLNFHKYGFLDQRRLLANVEEAGFWLTSLNPTWLFLWSDLYKPEIAFKNAFTYIRVYIKGEGIIYYPPIGKGDMRLALYEMKEDAKALGIDFNMMSIDDKLNMTLNSLRCNTLDNRDKFDYIYSAETLAMTSKKLFKKEIRSIKEFYSNNPDTFSRAIKKEDFPAILEFINNWNTNSHIDYANVDIYTRLNMIKKAMEHLYELSLVGIVLINDSGIMGFMLGSIINNVCYSHAIMALDIEGCELALIQAFTMLISRSARYISLECDNGNKEVRERFLNLKPLKLEKYYQTFLNDNED